MKKATNTAWITTYLQKRGKNLDTLATSLGRVTKKVITERANEIDIELSMFEKKADMISLIISHLEDLGYSHEVKAIPEKKEEAETAEYDDPYFKSEAAKVIFYLVEGQGAARTDTLHITKALYRDPVKAREWRNGLLKLIHPDVCNHPMAGKATQIVCRIYERMIATMNA